MTDKGTGLGAGTPIVLFPVMGKKENRGSNSDQWYLCTRSGSWLGWSEEQVLSFFVTSLRVCTTPLCN